MIKIATDGLDGKVAELAEIARQMPFALALAATRMAQRVRDGELSVMRKRLDKPTRTTMNSLFVKPATKAKPEARVWLKDAWNSGVPADRYMQAAVYGGVRGHKRFEKALIARGLMSGNQYAVPNAAFMDDNGNIKGQLSMKILSGLGAAETFAGTQANATGSRRSRKKGNADRYFVGEIDGMRGVWERRRMAMGDAVRPVFVFVDGAPRYRVRVPFFAIAENMVKANFQREFGSALERAIATARQRSGR
ncbi:hypothetical protein [Azotobacter beijerinckii]|uniref:Uncharacterized protein n=1 Tax=Azotobacter beijerinckii TaxID=170623 RepID=A0A1I4GA47_9GAMM|nr:hypothetical protein [Azotobacter beijerinckii]SFB46378.1 hypothetical protein SAMN04244571_03002 [Azotobacter beijerinckii]SFL26864.1 hypothetical protein SAMN04244574_03746 [Azotobacter beijerinckii]